MQGEPATKLRWLAGLILLAAAAALWWGLDRWERPADWLRVEAPRRAVANQPLTLRVHLAPLAEAPRLCADLHWGTNRDASMGYLATGSSKPVGREGGSFDFEIMVPHRPGLRFVTGIIYLSRTGTWPDHTLVATTEVITVGSNALDKAEQRLEPLGLRPASDRATEHPRPAAIPRWLTALLFLVAAVMSWRGSPPAAGSSGEPDGRSRWWQALAVTMVLACLWEVFGLEGWLGAQARAMARAQDLYYPRAVFQKAVVSATILATILFALFIRRQSGSHRLLVFSLALYYAIAMVNLVSWHPIDNFAYLTWHGLTLVQALKLGCAAMALLGVWNVAGSRAEQPVG